jgi:hypothetical protein
VLLFGARNEKTDEDVEKKTNPLRPQGAGRTAIRNQVTVCRVKYDETLTITTLDSRGGGQQKLLNSPLPLEKRLDLRPNVWLIVVGTMRWEIPRDIPPLKLLVVQIRTMVERGVGINGEGN